MERGARGGGGGGVGGLVGEGRDVKNSVYTPGSPSKPV